MRDWLLYGDGIIRFEKGKKEHTVIITNVKAAYLPEKLPPCLIINNDHKFEFYFFVPVKATENKSFPCFVSLERKSEKNTFQLSINNPNKEIVNWITNQGGMNQIAEMIKEYNAKKDCIKFDIYIFYKFIKRNTHP